MPTSLQDPVRCDYWADHSCGLSIVETEQSAEALTPLHVGVRAYRRWRSLQELVVESLVVSLTMVMLDVLVDDEAPMPLAERDDTMEAVFFDRPDEPLGIGVEIRTLRRQPDWPTIATCQDLAKDPRVEGIAVMKVLTPLYVKTRVQAAWMSSWRARKSAMTRW